MSAGPPTAAPALIAPPVRSVLGYVFACFLAVAALQPIWPRAAEPYTALLAAAAKPIVLWVQPTPIINGLSHRGTTVVFESALSPGATIGALETRHISFYLPFVVLLLVAARWRLRLVSLPEGALILALLFAVEVTCVAFGALRAAATYPFGGAGFEIIGRLEYSILHTLYHVHGNFGPQLWNGLVVALVLWRSVEARKGAPPTGHTLAASRTLAAACGVLILPSVLYVVAAPAVRRFTGQATLARRATARAALRDGNRELAGRLARELVERDPNDAQGMLILASVDEDGRPDDARRSYSRVTALEPGNVAARLGLARSDAKLGDLEAAVTEYYAALQLAPDRADAFEGLGDIYMRRHEYVVAMKHYREAGRLEPDRPRLSKKIESAGVLATRSGEVAADAD